MAEPIDSIDIVGEAPPLVGRALEGLLRQEYWYDGELEEPANIVHVKVDGLPWVRVFLDLGTLFWQPGDPPEGDEISGDRDEVVFRLIDVAAEEGLHGLRVLDITTEDRGDHVFLRLHLEGGVTAELHNEPAADRSDLTILRP